MRVFLKWTLGELQPLAEALGLWDDLMPLVEMANGAPNTADKLRAYLQKELGTNTEVPLEVLRTLAEAREIQVREDVEKITAQSGVLGNESGKIAEFLMYAREEARSHRELPVRFRRPGEQ